VNGEPRRCGAGVVPLTLLLRRGRNWRSLLLLGAAGGVGGNSVVDVAYVRRREDGAKEGGGADVALTPRVFVLGSFMVRRKGCGFWSCRRDATVVSGDGGVSFGAVYMHF
jgi:hypothetical protein